MNIYSNRRTLILQGDIAKVLLKLAGPIMLNNLIQTVYNLTDTYWVSKLGGTEIAAITLIWPVVFFIISIGMGINIAGTSLISQYIGADDSKNARNVAGQLISFSSLFSIALAIIGFFTARSITIFMGGKGELLEQASQYLQIIFLGLPLMYLFLVFTSIKQGQGDTVSPMKYSAISVTMNIILDPIFIFIFGMGISGAAIATVLARATFAIYAVYTLFYKERGIKIHFPDLKINLNLLKSILKIGLPSSIGQSTAALGFMVLNIFIISFGQSTLAAFGIGNRINSLILMPAMGIGNALATVIGQNLGADQIIRARKTVKTSAIITTSFMVLGGFIVFPFIPHIIRAFTDIPEISTQGITYLRLITISLPLMGFYSIFVGTFQGSGHTILAMIIMMGRLWAIRIPMIIFLKTYTNLGSNSVWYAMVLSNLIISIIGFSIYMSGKWEKRVIKKEKNAKKIVIS